MSNVGRIMLDVFRQILKRARKAYRAARHDRYIITDGALEHMR